MSFDEDEEDDDESEDGFEIDAEEDGDDDAHGKLTCRRATTSKRTCRFELI